MMTSLVDLCAKTIVKNNIVINDFIPNELWDKILYYSHKETQYNIRKIVGYSLRKRAPGVHEFTKTWKYIDEYIPLLGIIPMMWYGIEILPNDIVKNQDMLDIRLFDILETCYKLTYICISETDTHDVHHSLFSNPVICAQTSHLFENLDTKTCQCKFFN